MIDTILKKLNMQSVVIINTDDLENVLSKSEIIEEKNTHFRDMIRIIKTAEFCLVQEKTNKDDIVLRKVRSLVEAQKFVQNRMDLYENMWNGCGCRINYYE
jgi:hypothetical protein